MRKRITSILLACLLLLSAVPTAFAANDDPFTDVKAGDWFHDAVMWAYEGKVMNGTSATTFNPGGVTNRAMIAAILYRLESSPEVADSGTFSDVAAGAYYAEAVEWAYANGIISGYADGTYKPAGKLTREQMATILYRYAQYKKYDVSVGEKTDLQGYKDFSAVSKYAVPAMQWAVGAGVINGTSATTLSPAGAATRAQFAVILNRFCTDAAVKNEVKDVKLSVKSYDQQSMVTGYREKIDKGYTAAVSGAEFGIPAGIVIGLPSTNEELCQKTNFGSADLGIPVYDADTGEMYIIWGDTFSTHGHSSASVWADLTTNNGLPSRYWNNITIAKTNDTTYASLADGLDLTSFLTGTNVSGKSLQDGVWTDERSAPANIASPMYRVTETQPDDVEISKLSTGGIVVDGTIYVFFSSQGGGFNQATGASISTTFHYASCVKSEDGGRTWERVQDMTWDAYDLNESSVVDSEGNLVENGVRSAVSYFDIVGMYEENKAASGLERVYTVNEKSTQFDVAEENGAYFLAVRSETETDDRSFGMISQKEMTAGKTYDFEIVFRPSDGYKNQSDKAQSFFVSFGKGSAVDIDLSDYSQLASDNAGWYTLKTEFTPGSTTKELRFFINAAKKHGFDIKKVIVNDNATKGNVFTFDVGELTKVFNTHTAYHFTQFTPVQDKVGNGAHIYFLGQGGYRNDDIHLARVLKSEIENFDAYEYYAGKDASGNSMWSKKAGEAKPLIPTGPASNISIAYNAKLGKWMFTYFNPKREGGYGNQIRFADKLDGVYSEPYDLVVKEDAVNFVNFKPVKDYPFNDYIKGTYNLYGAYVSSRWISDDGLSFYCMMSQFHDCYNTSIVKVTLKAEYEK